MPESWLVLTSEASSPDCHLNNPIDASVLLSLRRLICRPSAAVLTRPSAKHVNNKADGCGDNLSLICSNCWCRPTSYVVKAHSVSDLDKAPAYTVTDEAEVILKEREVRSDKPEIDYPIHGTFFPQPNSYRSSKTHGGTRLSSFPSL